MVKRNRRDYLPKKNKEKERKEEDPFRKPGNETNKECFELSVLLGKLSIPFALRAGPDSSPAECSQELQSESTDSGTEFVRRVARKNLGLRSRCPFLAGNLLRQRNTSTLGVSASVCARVCFGSQHKAGVSCHPRGSGTVHAWGGPIILFFFHLNELLSCPPLISGV